MSAPGQLLDVVAGRSASRPRAPGSPSDGQRWRDAHRVRRRSTCRARTARSFDTMLPDAVAGRRSVPPGQARQHEARRVPPPGAERDPRPPRPQGRPALPVPPAAHQGRRTPRRPTAAPSCSVCSTPATLAARSARRGTPRKSCARSTTIDDPDLAAEFVDPPRPSTSKTESCPPEVRQLGRTIIRWRRPDRRLAPRPRVATDRPKRSTT